MTDEGADTIFQFGAAMLAPPRVIANTFSSAVTVRESGTGSHVIEGMRVFKAGTFADSMGVVRTWTTDDLDKMISNFNLLKDRNIFPNVPVRADHTDSVKDVVGYFVKLFRDSEDSNFLASDIEITEPDAFVKWQRGTWRSRSLEVGAYKTNGDNPQEFFPVVFGLAFVDIGAVEGLFSKENDSPYRFKQTIQDSDKSEENGMTTEEFARACAYAQALDDWTRAATYAQACVDWERAATYAAAVEAHERQASELGLATSNHGANNNKTLTFAMNGQMVTMTDQEVGQQLAGLMQFRQETIDTGRRDLVDTMVKEHKIAAPQADDMKKLVLTMSEDQFTAFKATYDKAPPMSLFGQYGDTGAGDPTGGMTDQEQRADEINILEGIVANHRLGGRTQEEIEKLDSFKQLTALKASKGQS